MEIETLARRLYDTHELTIRRTRGRAIIVCWGLLSEAERVPWRAVARRARALCGPRAPVRRRPRR